MFALGLCHFIPNLTKVQAFLVKTPEAFGINPDTVSKKTADANIEIKVDRDTESRIDEKPMSSSILHIQTTADSDKDSKDSTLASRAGHSEPHASESSTDPVAYHEDVVLDICRRHNGDGVSQT